MGTRIYVVPVVWGTLLGAAAVAGGGEVSSVAGWSLKKTAQTCDASPPSQPPHPSLYLEVRRADGATKMSFMGLQLPKNYAPGWIEYKADATVKLNGTTVFTTKTTKFERFFDLDNVGFENLQAMTAAGRITVEFNGREHEVVEYDSPGLDVGVAFLKECMGK